MDEDKRGAETSQAKSYQWRRLVISYGAAGLFGVAALAGTVVIVLSASNQDSGDAHIDQGTGSTNGVQPDIRVGTEPAPLKVDNLQRAARMAHCNLSLRLKDEGHKHISPTAPAPDYGTNPPTSGNHVEAPYQQADGAYREPPQEIDFVHSLEHGRLEIQYSSHLPESSQLELIGIYDTMYGATLLFPNEEMSYEVAATTWRHLLSCTKYRGSITLDAIRDFGMATWGRYGGQPVNTFDPTAPTPVEPTTK